MPWTLFENELDRLQRRYLALQQIATIVSLHPEWQQQEPVLPELLQTVAENGSQSTLEDFLYDCLC